MPGKQLCGAAAHSRECRMKRGERARRTSPDEVGADTGTLPERTGESSSDRFLKCPCGVTSCYQKD